MRRKQIAQDTLRYMEQGYYAINGQKIEFSNSQKYSEDNSILITPMQGVELVRGCELPAEGKRAEQRVRREATVKTIRDFAGRGASGVGVLNFASAKNPGGGFLNGAMAQEESLAASSGLYRTQLRNEEYYLANRACNTMMYTDYAIYSPDVVFFRDERFELLKQPVTASVLTLPAVNYGQVLLKGEDSNEAKRVMKDRMRLALAIFADRGAKYLIFGAYGCGVFRNHPVEVAGWWEELLEDEGYSKLFDEIVFAVLDNSKGGTCIRAFEDAFGRGRNKLITK
ncbi:TIGR02452 family protein [Paenibacillus arenosi]|uniref:TIGR02452 family protein n=1 Tax=Paenibacillus arenosi TaxID=2774142 RepID=A0ABR9AWI0_9BACL|nr:TIGR02452 family protein [Paenibacillus arenosi]MBD8497555.1 TIGR02452 family protein [Paenibacillus arenosi]